MTDQRTATPGTSTPLAVRSDHYCFGCGSQNPYGLKLRFFADSDDTVWTEWTPSRENEGFTGMAHGGIITTVLDEVMGWATYYLHVWAVTAKLEVRFRKPVEIGAPCIASARVTGENGRKVMLRAKLRHAETQLLLADAEGVFIKVPADRAIEWEQRYMPAAPSADRTAQADGTS